MAGTLILKGRRCRKGSRRCRTTARGKVCVRISNIRRGKCKKGTRKCVNQICYTKH